MEVIAALILGYIFLKEFVKEIVTHASTGIPSHRKLRNAIDGSIR
jgi:hypothetical protein